MQALRKISVTQRPSWSNKLVESQSCSTSASRFCVSSWQSRSNNGFLKHKMKLPISEGVKPLWTRDRETDASSTRIFSHSGVWMSLKLPCPTAMWSNYRNSWHSERNSLASSSRRATVRYFAVLWSRLLVALLCVFLGFPRSCYCLWVPWKFSPA